jgi:hypothetical protein
MRVAGGKPMPFRNSVSIVVSPRARVGKTLLARLLVDFHAQEGRAVEAFDLNTGDGTLVQFSPERATISTVADIKGQMALFDRLITADETYKVVDLGHAAFEAFFAVAQKIGFVEEAHRRAIAPAILYLTTPDATAVEAFRTLRRQFPEALLAPVHNEIFGPAQRRGKYELGGAALTCLPALAPGLRRHIETPPFSFAGLAALPPAVVDELQHWLRRAYREFRELDLRILLADLQAAMRLPL